MSQEDKHCGDSVTKSQILNIVLIQQKQIYMQIHRNGFVVLFPSVCFEVTEKMIHFGYKCHHSWGLLNHGCDRLLEN